MGIAEIIVLGIALSLDAFAVTISDALAYNKESLAHLMLLPVAFGVFQGLMPALGYILSGAFAHFIQTYAGIISLIILSVIGGNMIRDGVTNNEDVPDPHKHASLSLPLIVFQAIATSIDAFAVGISLRAQDVQIASCSIIICVTTFILSLVALTIGKKFGSILGDRAQIAGGIVLICIGIHAMM